MSPPAARQPAVPWVEDPPLAWFAAAFALALLAHQLWWRGLPVADGHGVVAALAAWVLLKPGAPVPLTMLAAAEAVVVAGDLPTVGDHTLLAAVTAAAFLAAVAAASVRARGIPAPAALWAQLAPFLRVQAVVLYGAAALAKLNSGFLDTATSCAGPLASQLAFFDPSLLDGTWHVGPTIAATVVAEAGLAVLLAFGRTRVAGVVLGVGFHAMLALAGNVPFAAYALALYVAFLPAGALPAWRRPSLRVVVGAGALVVALWLVALGAEAATVRDVLRPVLRVVVAAALLTFAATVLRRPRDGGAPGRVLALRPGYAVAAALLLGNAASPYVGLKTEATFTMFSNLQTEPGYWNHLIVPEAVRVFGAQDQLVRITASTAPTLERRQRAGALMVRAELERYLREHPAQRASFGVARDPSLRVTASAAALPARPFSDRVMNFYDVRAGARGRC